MILSHAVLFLNARALRVTCQWATLPEYLTGPQTQCNHQINLSLKIYLIPHILSYLFLASLYLYFQ